MKLRTYGGVKAVLRLKGEWFSKKHGNWIRLYLTKNHFLAMDTWNGKVQLCKGSGLYNYWTGFSGVPLITYGYDFGNKWENTNISDYYTLNELSYDKWNYIKLS